ncbi:rhamnogalacturonan acetylesterase [Halioxenophilus aromaticivorans]|uniref:Rhamnogalacturonan acetylesterase n=1 Tax=Halioxenophilus aromaticivorans TaxID=1306992 RepID=A0AAV3U8I6_9ALTE
MKTQLLFALFTVLSMVATSQAEDSTDGKVPVILFIAGDSTAASYDNKEQQGWGGVLQEYFEVNKVRIDNRARGGRSSRTFMTEGHWQKLITDVNAGDIVVIQFGHNDASPVNDSTRARGSLPGLGEESRQIDNMLTGEPEVVYTFGHYIQKMIDEVKQKQARPILISLTVRNLWQNNRIERGSGEYGAWLHSLAATNGIDYIDLTNEAADIFEHLGKELTDTIYEKDYAHFNETGAHIHARTIVNWVKGLRPTLPSDSYSALGQDVASNHWAFLRLPVIQDKQKPTLFLVGDSTVRNGTADGSNGEWGWGSFLADYLASIPVNVVNRAIGGFSSRTYITGNHWHKSLNMMRPGDYVAIQFGHNDASPVNDTRRARGSLDGIDSQVQTVFNLLTGQQETVYSYGHYLRQYISDAKAKGVTPIVITPVPRKLWSSDSNTIQRDQSAYPDWATSVAESAGVPVVDLFGLVANQYDRLGITAVEALFADKHTHTSQSGAQLNAQIAAEQLSQYLMQ